MKKKNPHITLRESDIRGIKRDCTEKATNYAIILLLSVMHDKHGYGKKRLSRILNQLDDLADSIAKGYVRLEDLRSMIEDECGIVVFNRKVDDRKN